MAEAPVLTIAYLERLPEASASVIEDMRPQDAAALFETLPTRIVTPIFEKMEKWPAARCLQQLTPDKAAAVLADVSYQDATVLLRLTPADQRESILARMPTRLANDLRESLRYPRNCVGAWMDLSVPALSLGATVKDAVAIARERPVGDALFVVDGDQRLAGFVRAETLLRYSAGTRLADIIQTGLRPLFARTLLREVASEPMWNRFLRLPVAGRDGHLLGVLSRHDMTQGLTTITATPARPDAEAPLLQQVGETFIVSLAGLVRLFDGDSDNSGTSSGT
jgi:Mg/Co/Ni transporter MgtE